jgi:nickel-dependent lactate racemase
LASAAVAEGGLIAMLAECSQGVGDDRYLEYASRYSSACEAFEDFQRHPFRMGAHKSYLFGKTLSRYAVVVESELAPEILARCHLRAGKAEAAVRDFVEAAAGPVRLAVVPYANTTFFIGPKS